MGNYLKTIYLYATTTLKRNLRDPVTTLIFLGVPVLIMVVFGLFVTGEKTLNLRTVIINQSDTEIARQFEQTIRDTKAFKIDDKIKSSSEAKQAMEDDALDTIIELSAGFGRADEQGQPHGNIMVYLEDENSQTGKIAQSVINGMADGYNRNLTRATMPINTSVESVGGGATKPIQELFSLFTGVGMIMLGILGVAMMLASDKKAQIFRRFSVTAMKKSQIILGTGLAFLAFGAGVLIIMTLLAVFPFAMPFNGNWFVLAGFMLLSLIMMIGLGLAVGAVAKNPSQSVGLGQVIFLGSLALGGVWIPIASMPEFLQSIVAYMPLNAVIEGVRNIVVEGAAFTGLLPQITIISVWIALAYGFGSRMFKWE